MNEDVVVHFRKAVKRDVDFLSQILVSAAAASGVEVQMAELSIKTAKRSVLLSQIKM